MRDQSHWKEIVAPILCTLAAFVIFVLVAQNSQTFRDCIENYQYKAAQSSLPKLSDVVIPFGIRVNCWGRYINEVANGTIAVFTIILAGSTIALWLSTKRLWQVTDDTLRQAPWRFQILNFGKTPGVILRVEWGRCPDGEFPRQIPVSEIIDKNLLPKRMQQKIDMSPRFILSWMNVSLAKLFSVELHTRTFSAGSMPIWLWLCITVHLPSCSSLNYTDTITMSFADDWS